MERGPLAVKTDGKTVRAGVFIENGNVVWKIAGFEVVIAGVSRPDCSNPDLIANSAVGAEDFSAFLVSHECGESLGQLLELPCVRILVDAGKPIKPASHGFVACVGFRRVDRSHEESGLLHVYLPY